MVSLVFQPHNSCQGRHVNLPETSYEALHLAAANGQEAVVKVGRFYRGGGIKMGE